MKMKKYKNYILFSIILLSQVHVFFRGSDIRLEWFLNGKVKTINFAVFLFFVHLRFLIFSYLMWKPKGISKDVPLFFFIVSVFDLLHFVFLSGYGYAEIKVFSAFIVFLLTRKVLNYG